MWNIHTCTHLYTKRSSVQFEVWIWVAWAREEPFMYICVDMCCSVLQCITMCYRMWKEVLMDMCPEPSVV